MPTLDGYTKQFAQRHPAIGEIKAGSTVSAEQAAQLAKVFDSKIVQLSRKQELTHREKTFVDNVADLASRNITWAVDHYGMKVPEETDGLSRARTAAHRIAEVTGREWPQAADGSDKNAVLAIVEPLAGHGNGTEMRSNPALRSPREEYAAGVLSFTADLVAANNGLTVDRYMAENLRNMLSHYEMVDAEAAIAAQTTQAAMGHSA